MRAQAMNRTFFRYAMGVGVLAGAALWLNGSPAVAQAAPSTYQCPANATCNVSCAVDGEKIVQTGAPKTVSVRLLAPNNYLIELIEQNNRVQYAYAAGTKIVCALLGLVRQE